MNIADYDLNEIKLGQKVEFKITITNSMLNEFAKLSGDYNPLHMDDDYAAKTDFKRRVCHGILLSSFFSQIVGMHIPGQKALYLSQTLKFVSPCFIDDEVIVYGQVIGKSEATRILTPKTIITNISGKTLVEGQAKVLVRK